MSVRSQFAWRATCVALALVLAHALPATARTLAAIDALATLPAADPVARSAQLAAAPMNDATVQTEPRFGVPTFLWGTTASATLKALQRTPSAKTLAGCRRHGARAFARPRGFLSDHRFRGG